MTKIMHFKGVWLASIGCCDAHLLPAHMVLRKIQDQKQKYNLEWFNQKIMISPRYEQECTKLYTLYIIAVA